MSDTFSFATLAGQPNLADDFWPQKQRIWPAFMFHDRYADAYWHYLLEQFPAYQRYLLDEQARPVTLSP